MSVSWSLGYTVFGVDIDSVFGVEVFGVCSGLVVFVFGVDLLNRILHASLYHRLNLCTTSLPHPHLHVFIIAPLLG